MLFLCGAACTVIGERIIAPLGMHNTTWSDESVDKQKLATGYARSDDRGYVPLVRVVARGCCVLFSRNGSLDLKPHIQYCPWQGSGKVCMRVCMCVCVCVCV